MPPKRKESTIKVSSKTKHVPKILIFIFIIMILLLFVSIIGGQTKHCSSRGRWVGDYCLCDYGYSGKNCEVWSCRSSEDCGGQMNRCVRGKCICDQLSDNGMRCDGRPTVLESRIYGNCYPTKLFQSWAPCSTILWMLLASVAFIWWIAHLNTTYLDFNNDNMV